MKVKNFMITVPNIVFVSDKITIEDAGRTLLEKHIGSLLVLNSKEEKRVISGIVTKSDVIEGYLKHKGDESVEFIMKKKFVYAQEEAEAAKVAELMAKKQIHHVLILNDKKHLVGLVSSLNIAREVLEDAKDTFPYYRSLFGIPKKKQMKITKGVKDVVEDIMNAIVFPEPVSVESYQKLE